MATKTAEITVRMMEQSRVRDAVGSASRCFLVTRVARNENAFYVHYRWRVGRERGVREEREREDNRWNDRG